MVTRENYEEYIMMYADGELKPAEVRALMAFLEEHPELKKELAAYGQVRLVPDKTQVFENKESLLKMAPANRIVSFPQWKRYGIAAGIAALICVSLFEFVHKNNDNVEMAKTDSVVPKNVQQASSPTAIAGGPQKQNNPAAVPDTTVQQPSGRRVAGIAVVRKTDKSRKKEEQTIQKNQLPVIAEAPALHELSLTAIKKMPSATERVSLAEVKDIPEYTMPVADETNKKTFWEKLPLGNTQREQLENIASAAVNVYEKASTAKEDIQSKSLTIRIEKGRLLVSF